MLKFKWETEFKETEIGEIPKDWEVRKIKELGKVITGKTPPTGIKEYWQGTYPFITPSDIPDYDIRYGYEVKRFLSKLWFQKVQNLLLPKDTPCFVCIGSTIGKVCITREKSFTNQQINSIILSEEHNSLFIFYNLRANQFKIRDEFGGGGAAKDIISKSKFEQVLLPVPPTKKEQSRIATVLSWFDDLIENKKRQNEILEKVAMAIFKSWFVDFEPFKDEGFVYNEELGKEIPKGWEVKPIGEVADFVKGLSYRSNELVDNPTEGEIFITLKIFKRGGGFRPEYKYYKGNRYSEEQVVYDGDLVIALTDMTSDAKVVGAPALVILPPDRNKGILSLDAAKLNAPQYMKEYVYLYLKDSQEENSTFANGVNVLHLNLNLFKVGKLILIPPQPILQRFHSLVEPLFQKIILNQKQIMVLKKIRDALLPKLVFGKLRVEEI